MSQAIEQLEQQQSILEKDNKRLNKTNDELLEITKKQKCMVKEDVPATVEPKVPSAKDITNQYRKSIYKKLADLENQLLNSPTPLIMDDFNFDEKDAKQMLKLKVQIHSLLQENKSLKDRLLDFQNLHDQVMSEIRSKMIGNRTKQQQGNNATTNSFPVASGSLDKNNLQPLQVNVVDGDTDEIKDE